jgi:hypothetical protein
VISEGPEKSDKGEAMLQSIVPVAKDRRASEEAKRQEREEGSDVREALILEAMTKALAELLMDAAASTGAGEKKLPSRYWLGGRPEP